VDCNSSYTYISKRKWKAIMGHIKFVTGLVMIALFTIALIGFGSHFAEDNDASTSIIDDALFEVTQEEVTGNVSVFNVDMNTSSKALAESTISTQTEASEGGTSFKVGPWTALSMARKTIAASFERIFGSEFSIFFTALISILVFMTIMYIIKAWFGRNPD
jgi:hypothetical protein